MPISPETAQALAAELRGASGLCNESVRTVKVQEALGELHAYTDLASRFMGNSLMNILHPLWTDFPDLKPAEMNEKYIPREPTLSPESRSAIATFLEAARRALDLADQYAAQRAPLPPGGVQEVREDVDAIERFLDAPKFRKLAIGSREGRDLAIPILPSSSLENTIRFFGHLGFKGHIVGDGYAIVTRGELEVHFFWYPEVKAAESFAGCYFRVADVDKLYEAFSQARLPSRGIPRIDRLEVKPWRMKEFAIIDEDGNLYRIGQVIDDVLKENQ